MSSTVFFQVTLFQISAIFNTSVGLVLLFVHQWLFSLLGFEITTVNSYIAITQLAGMAILTFGLGYYLVSKNIKQNIGIIKLGIISKIAVFVIFSSAFYHNNDMLPFFIAGLGELTFVALFIIALKKLSKNNLLANVK